MRETKLSVLKVNAVGAAAFMAIGWLLWSAGGVSDAQTQTNIQPPASASAQPPPMALPPGVNDVVKLAHSGIGDEVILAKIKNDGASYNLTSDQIIYLSKVGVPQNVLAALLQGKSSSTTATAVNPESRTAVAPPGGIAEPPPLDAVNPAINTPATAQPAIASQPRAATALATSSPPQAPAAPDAASAYAPTAAPALPNAPAAAAAQPTYHWTAPPPAGQPTALTPSYAPPAAPQSYAPATAPQTYAPAAALPPVAPGPFSPPTEASLASFQRQLAPYGNWVEVPGYGPCWQPSVPVGWRPYYDGGHWLYTDNGWYWQSEYPWGDIAFHYGRWTFNGNYGWLWVPGYEYAPAWVFWRHAEGYCGWAPLPAGTLFVGGVWRYNGVRVGVGFDFGLTVGLFTFVAYDHFWEHDYRRFVVPHERVIVIYRGSYIVNNYRVVNGRVIHEGLGRERMAQLTHREVREEKLHEVRAREQHEDLERRKADMATHQQGGRIVATAAMHRLTSPDTGSHSGASTPTVGKTPGQQPSSTTSVQSGSHDQSNPAGNSHGKGGNSSEAKDRSKNKKADN